MIDLLIDCLGLSVCWVPARISWSGIFNTTTASCPSPSRDSFFIFLISPSYLPHPSSLSVSFFRLEEHPSSPHHYFFFLSQPSCLFLYPLSPSRGESLLFASLVPSPKLNHPTYYLPPHSTFVYILLILKTSFLIRKVSLFTSPTSSKRTVS